MWSRSSRTPPTARNAAGSGRSSPQRIRSTRVTSSSPRVQFPSSTCGRPETLDVHRRIDVQTHFSGMFQDSFSIFPPPVSAVTWLPANPAAGDQVQFSVSTAGGIPPYTYRWSFGDGTQATGQSPTHAYSSNSFYNLTLTSMDSAGNSRSTQQLLGVGSWNPAVPCSPTISTLENLLGSVTIQRNQTDQSSLGADYSGGGFKLDGNLTYGSNPTNWPFSKRAEHPFLPPLSSPCSSILGVPAFVEIHDLTVLSSSVADCGFYYDISNGGVGGVPYPNGQSCSTTLNLANQTSPCPACFMHRLYAIIDRDWKASGIAPSSPSKGKLVDVQGFVYWNSQNVDQPWHYYTGWELHISAWRISPSPPSRQPTSILSGPAIWYVLGAIGSTAVIVVGYAIGVPSIFRRRFFGLRPKK